MKLMHYMRGISLLPLSPPEFQQVDRVPFRGLLDKQFLVYDETVSHFFFEFEPQRDIELFLQHAHFATRQPGRLTTCYEDLLEVAALEQTAFPAECMLVDLDGEFPKPFKGDPLPESLAAIKRGGEFRGQITICSCWISGCFS